MVEPVGAPWVNPGHVRTPGHASVVVIGSDIERRLWPYREDFEIPLEEQLCECIEDGWPDPGCKFCDGTRYRYPSLNPMGKWEWWQIGGIWSNLLVLKGASERPQPGSAIST
jgi:hypothetical protein